MVLSNVLEVSVKHTVRPKKWSQRKIHMKIPNLSLAMGTTLALLTTLLEQPLCRSLIYCGLSWAFMAWLHSGCLTLQLRTLSKSVAISVTISMLSGFQFAVDKAISHCVLLQCGFCFNKVSKVHTVFSSVLQLCYSNTRELLQQSPSTVHIQQNIYYIIFQIKWHYIILS